MTRKFLVFTIMLFALMSIYPLAIKANDARIAVASEGTTADAPISIQAARCPYFLLFNNQGQLVEAVANPLSREARGAGPQVVEFLSGKGVHTVVAGEFGARMITAMKQKDMVFYTETGSAADAVARLQTP
ncbi:MAG: NifB/NifX family molybdenum-iron cluster-binding protein [Desulfobacterales bacterium]|jgi:predicted Fe-Mo cluster-binding NifX family protein|nr:NifB/NifX family molybdenum-iron cluster-binding protein [Desulfobacterales bacterium]